MNFAERLKELMDENSTSNYELGKKTGTHPTTVTNWLAGSIPQPRKIKAIAEFYNVSIEYLKGETDIKEKAAPISGDDFPERDIQLMKIIDSDNLAMQRLLLAGSVLDSEDLERLADLAESLAKAKAR